MSLFLVLILFLLPAVNPESAAFFPENSTGLNFVFVFPENIVYYYSAQSLNQFQVTAFFNDTQISVFSSTVSSKTLNAGQTEVFLIDPLMALKKEHVSNKTVQIKSSKHVVVHVIIHRNNSVQTAVVMPTDKLSTDYIIPQVPTIRGTTAPWDSGVNNATEKGPFRVIVINTDKQNSVTLESKVDKPGSNFELQPYQSKQFWVTEQGQEQTLTATEPVAVYFGHPCAIRYNCTCGLLYTVLTPAEDNTLKFFIAQDLVEDAGKETSVLVSGKESTTIQTFDQKSPLVEVSGSAILYRPGLLLNLISENDFASCFTISGIKDMENFAVIVVHKDYKNGICLGNEPLQDPNWQELMGTEYTSTKVKLQLGTNVIWHKSFKVAVYFLGQKGNTVFGNSAALVSKNPDFRGCSLSPEILDIGNEAGGWRESLKYCKDKNLDLISLPTPALQNHIMRKLNQTKIGNKQVWIGFRMSSLNGEWYWMNSEAVSYTNWEEGKPSGADSRLCAMMSLETGKNFSWHNEDCCTHAHPLCYKAPMFLPL
ncbi:uncharacterized protein LOC117513211 [Thalassophryne amazonica]|uniref:uncharacterized protein LOC117513211 n=1 Tax=Thalassophryne amazonica TaxID=390379 RepID=UPI0014714CBA|nr:uncharacterized protein LOC117513211 [Thalassophryne amazonica]